MALADFNPIAHFSESLRTRWRAASTRTRAVASDGTWPTHGPYVATVLRNGPYGQDGGRIYQEKRGRPTLGQSRIRWRSAVLVVAPIKRTTYAISTSPVLAFTHVGRPVMLTPCEFWSTELRRRPLIQ
jgi:hypothetical protein